MARTNNLTNFLTDVATSIKAKTGDSTAIPASQFDTKIAGIETGKLTQAEYDTADDDLDDILENTIVPSGTISITENGNYDVTNYISANVNVPENTSKYFRNTIENGNANGSGLLQMIKEIPSDTTISGTSCAYMFYRAFNLVRIPENFNTTGSTSFKSMFAYCESLVDLPILNSASVTDFNSFVYDCISLSNESLNNVLKICIDAVSYQSTKTLKNIGLSSEQATTCTGLSNWSALQALGWTTGY